MPVENLNVIDLVTHNPRKNEVTLIMVEARHWDATPIAIQQLDSKLHLYGEFIVSGKLAQSYPQFANLPVFIRLDHFGPITEVVAKLLRKWTARFASVPIGICSHRIKWNPIGRFLRKLAGKSGEQEQSLVYWKPEPGILPFMDYAKFADACIAVVAKGLPPMTRIEAVNEFEFKVTLPDGKSSTLFLENAYKQYLLEPENIAEILRKYSAAFAEAVTRNEKSLVLDRIVPVLKDKLWVTEMQKGMKARHGKDDFSFVFEVYNDELVIAYAEDSPTSIRYLTRENLEEAGLKLEQLRKMACSNLLRLIPTPDIRLDGGVYQVRAGGDYDATLLVNDEFWEQANIKVSGEIVAIVPSRDCLLVCDSLDEKAVKTLKLLSTELASKASYRLTPTLFARRGGQFVRFG